MYSEKEIKRIWKACESIGWPFGFVGKLLLVTAQRRGEVTAIRREDIDRKTALWRQARTKSGNGNEVPLTPLALETIDAVPKIEGSPFLFSTTEETAVSGFSKATETIREKSGVADFRFHDLRRTVRTKFSELGVGPDVAERVLGHVIRGVRGVYDRYHYLPEKRAALEKWDVKLREILAAKDADETDSEEAR